jgi:hypothetical protein
VSSSNNLSPDTSAVSSVAIIRRGQTDNETIISA